MRTITRPLGIVVTTLGLGLAVSACGAGAVGGTSAAGGSTLTIGLVIPQTGPYASLGQQMKSAAQLYLKEHDNKVGGHKAALVVADSAGDPATATQKAKELVLKDHVDVITGVVSSPEAVALAKEADADKVPLVIANAGADEVTGPHVSPYVWRVSQSNYMHGYAAGVYAATKVSKSGGVFMGSDYSAGTETLAGFRAGYAANGGGKLLDTILTPYDTTQNYQPYLGKIPAKSKFVYAFYAGGEAVTFVKNWKDFGYDKKVPLIGAQNLTDEDILPAVGNAADGLITVGLYSPALKNATNNAFVAAWSKAYHANPSIVAVTTHDAMTFIDSAAAKVTGDVDGQALVDQFGKVGKIDSPSGTFTIDPTTHNPVRDYYVRKLESQNGTQVNTVLETISGVKDD